MSDGFWRTSTPSEPSFSGPPLPKKQRATTGVRQRSAAPVQPEAGSFEAEEESSSEDEDEDGPKIVDEEDVKVTKKAKSAEGKPKKAAVEAAPKKQRKPKKEKDPNAPKRATSAFFYFSQDHRGRIKAANPGFGMGDIAKALGAEWKALTAEEKAPYDERAKADKERYQAQQAVYKASKGAAAADDEEAGGEEEGGDDEPAAAPGALSSPRHRPAHQMEPSGVDGGSWSAASSPKLRRHLFIAAEDTRESAAACEWALRNVYKEGDVLHMTYVVQCLQPQLEVFHGMPGTAFSFTAPANAHQEQHIISSAKQKLEDRFLPLLRPQMVPYQLHLLAEKCDCGVKRVAELLLQDIEQRDAAMVVLSAHNKPGTAGGLGSVAEHIAANCRRPTAIVRPQAHGQ